MRQLLYALCAVLLLVGCGTRPKPKQATDATATTESYVPGTRRMKRSAEDIYSLHTKEEYMRAIESYWDDFDFSIGDRIVEYDTVDIFQAFADYVMLIPAEHADSLMRGLMHRAEESRPVLDLFASVAEMVLHDPNSPLRNDEYYIPILEVLVATPLYDEYDRIAPTYDLAIARQNRIGSVATNFRYTLANGRREWLHDIEARYTILMFSNPGCPMCHDIQLQLMASPLINELRERGELAIITIYPDEDIAAWRNYLKELPEGWIHGYDEGMHLTTNRLYNLNAIPSLYLLDGTKRVLVKDGTSVPYIENIIALSEAQ